MRDSESFQSLSEKDRLIRQFLRGDAEGPITDRVVNSDYEDDILMVSLKSEKD